MAQYDIEDGDILTATDTTAGNYPFNLNMASGLHLHIGSGGPRGSAGSNVFAVMGSQVFTSGTVHHHVMGFADMVVNTAALGASASSNLIAEWRVFSNVNGSEAAIKQHTVVGTSTDGSVNSGRVNGVFTSNLYYTPNGSELGSGFEIRVYGKLGGTAIPSTGQLSGLFLLGA